MMPDSRRTTRSAMRKKRVPYENGSGDEDGDSSVQTKQNHEQPSSADSKTGAGEKNEQEQQSTIGTFLKKDVNGANGSIEMKSPVRPSGGFVSINGRTTIGRTIQSSARHIDVNSENKSSQSSRTLSPASIPFPASSPVTASASTPAAACSGLPINAVSFSQFLKSHHHHHHGGGGGDTSSGSGFIASSSGCSVNHIDTETTKNTGISSTTLSHAKRGDSNPMSPIINHSSQSLSPFASESMRTTMSPSKQISRRDGNQSKASSASSRSRSRETNGQNKSKRKILELPARKEQPYEGDLRDLVGILLSDLLEEELNSQMRQAVETRAHHGTSCLTHQFHNDVRKRANTLLGLPPAEMSPRDILTPAQKAFLTLGDRQQNLYDDPETDTDDDTDDMNVQSTNLAENTSHVDHLRKQVLSDWCAVRSKFERKWDWLSLRMDHLHHELQETDLALADLRIRSQQERLQLEATAQTSNLQRQEQQRQLQLQLQLQRRSKARIQRSKYYKLTYPPSRVKDDIAKHMIFSQILHHQSQAVVAPPAHNKEMTKEDVLMALRIDQLGYVTNRRRMSSSVKASRKPNLHVSVPDATNQAARLRHPRTPMSRRVSSKYPTSTSTSTPRTSSRRRATPSSSHVHRDYDIDDIIVPWGVLRSGSTIDEVKPKEIFTPKWVAVENSQRSLEGGGGGGGGTLTKDNTIQQNVKTICTTQPPEAIPQSSSDENSSDEFYCTMHFGMEYDERKRAYDFLTEPTSATRKKKEVINKEEDARQRAQHIPSLLDVKRIFSVKRLRLQQNDGEEDDEGDENDGDNENMANINNHGTADSLLSNEVLSPFSSPISVSGPRTPLSSPRSASKSRHSQSRKKEPPRHLQLKVETYVSHPYPEPYSTRGNYEEMREIARLKELTRELEEQEHRMGTQIRHGKSLSRHYDRYRHHHHHQAVGIADDDEFVFDFSDQEHDEYYDDSYQESDSDDVDEFGESLVDMSPAPHRKRQRTEFSPENTSAWEVAQKVGPLRIVLRKLT